MLLIASDGQAEPPLTLQSNPQVPRYVEIQEASVDDRTCACIFQFNPQVLPAITTVRS